MDSEELIIKRTCKICHQEKDLHHFTHDYNYKHGIKKIYYYKTCKVCDAPRMRAKSKRRAEKCRRKLADKQKIYHAAHREQDALTKKLWYHKNKEKIKLKRKIFLQNKRKTNIYFKIKESFSALVRSCISKNRESIIKYLPYSLIELKNHLESQFQPWMSWENWGKYNAKTWNDQDQSTWTWNIDHLIPMSHFKYISMNDEQFQQCWALKNLRPYSAKLNILEGNRR